MTSTETPTSVGQQLKARREALDLTQGALARRIGIDASTVSLTERDRTEIQRGRRAAWEQALLLKAGSITRAYQDGAPLEPAEVPAEPPYADMNDRLERAIWQMADLSEEDRRDMIRLMRLGKEREAARRRPA